MAAIEREHCGKTSTSILRYTASTWEGVLFRRIRKLL
jgi:hypothetical protein